MGEQEMREAFEAEFPMPPSLFWNGEQYGTIRSDTGALMDSLTHRGRWEGWQAATLAAEETFNQRLVELTSRIREKCMQVATTVRYAALSGPVERCELDAIISRALTDMHFCTKFKRNPK